ncbi:MAG TPA: hypothetical protein VGH82_13580 [Gaiellaceae bacterium]|jgi:hypothetical protein
MSDSGSSPGLREETAPAETEPGVLTDTGIDDLDLLRRQLTGRKEMCWERLEDAADELMLLHGETAASIVDRIEEIGGAAVDGQV